MLTEKTDRWLHLPGELGEMNGAVLGRDIVDLMEKDPSRPVTLFITSPGGTVRAAIAFFELMRLLKPNLNTVALGEVNSMAVPVFLAGARRFITEHSKIFLHEVGRVFEKDVYFGGRKIQKISKEVHADQRRYASIVAKCSGGKLSNKRVVELMLANVTLNAKDAVKFGLAHEIL